MSSVGSFFSYVNDVRSHEPEVHIISFSGNESFFAGGRMDGQLHRQISIMKLIVAFRNFAIAPEVLNFVHINTPVFHMILTTI